MTPRASAKLVVYVLAQPQKLLKIDQKNGSRKWHGKLRIQSSNGHKSA